MSDPIQGIVLFADDVRNEVNDKSSIMGIAGGKAIVRGYGKGSVRLHCVILLWAATKPIDLRAEMEVFGVDGEFKAPTPLELKLPDDEEEEGFSADDPTLLQVVAQLRPVPVHNKPVTIKCTVTANETVLVGRLTLDPVDIEEDDEELEDSTRH